jgi:hypothetical protein
VACIVIVDVDVRGGAALDGLVADVDPGVRSSFVGCKLRADCANREIGVSRGRGHWFRPQLAAVEWKTGDGVVSRPGLGPGTR